MRRLGPISETVAIEVAFHDVDVMGVVWHGHYFKYLENARWKLMDRLGYGYVAMRDSGFLWPIIETHVRHIRPAAFGDRLAVTEATVEADREASRRTVGDRTAHSHDALDMCEQGLCLSLAVAGVEDHNLHRRPCRAKCLLQRYGRYELCTAIVALEEQAVRLLYIGHALATLAAKVDDRWLELAQLAKQIEWLRGPASLEHEAVPVAGALELLLNRACLAIQCESIEPARIGGQEQDRVFHRHCRS